MTAPEERQADVTVPGHLDSIGACRSLTVTSVSEIGWWSTERLLDDIKSGGGAAACQWGMHFDPDNAAGSCTLLEVEDRLGKVTRILLDAGWSQGYMSERLRATGVDHLLRAGGIDFLFLTHEHLDHFWGIEAVLQLAPEITILVPGTISDNGLAWLGGGAFPAAGIENRVPHRDRRALKTGRISLARRRTGTLCPELRIPSAEDTLKLVVEHPGAALQEQVGAALGPLHLLTLDHALADHLVDR